MDNQSSLLDSPRSAVLCPCCNHPASALRELPRAQLETLLIDARVLTQEQMNHCRFGDYRLMQCSSCELEFSDPMNEPDESFYLISDDTQPMKLLAVRSCGSGQGLQSTIARASRGSISGRRNRRLNRYAASARYRRAYLRCLSA